MHFGVLGRVATITNHLPFMVKGRLNPLEKQKVLEFIFMKFKVKVKYM